jgi:twinkle protein
MFVQEFLNMGITPKGNNVEQKVICPKCVQLGKTNWKDTCLSINIQQGLYNCHKCGYHGKINENNNYMATNNQPTQVKRAYKKPSTDYMAKLKDEGRKFLNDRGITDEVIKNNNIVSSKDNRSVVFPYFKNGQVTNYKTRQINGKSFTQAKDAQPIIYNYDRVKEAPSIIICEGEMDSLSWEVAGLPWHTSVNMGAPNKGDKNIDKKLECLSNCYEVFEQAKRIYIATDNDENGRILERELLRRFGADKCKLVDLRPFKDANEVLLKEGVESLRKRIETAYDPKVEGVFEVNDVMESMLDGFKNGQERGTTTYVSEVDKAWTWRMQEVNIWTGYQNEGKSLFLNQLATIKAIKDGWKFGIFSPENMPMRDFFNDIIEMYIGKSADPYYNHQMTEAEYKEGIEFVKKHFFVIYPKKNFTLDNIFERAKFLVRQKGIRSLIIDPYNTVQHKMYSGEREDLYISRFMSELKRFAIDYDISVNLVAHQVTPIKGEDGRYYKPDVNRIKGGGTFADKADNVMFVWRPNRALDFSDTSVIFGSQKIKKQKLVGIPQEVTGINFNIKEQRYYFNGYTPFSEIDVLRCEKKRE